MSWKTTRQMIKDEHAFLATCFIVVEAGQSQQADHRAARHCSTGEFSSILRPINCHMLLMPFMYDPGVVEAACVGCMLSLSLNHAYYQLNAMTYSRTIQLSSHVLFICVPNIQLTVLSLLQWLASHSSEMSLPTPKT